MLEFVDVKVANRIDSLTLQIKIGSFEVAHWIELRKVAEFIHDEVRSGRLIFWLIGWNFEFWRIFLY